MLVEEVLGVQTLDLSDFLQELQEEEADLLVKRVQEKPQMPNQKHAQYCKGELFLLKNKY